MYVVARVVFQCRGSGSASGSMLYTLVPLEEPFLIRVQPRKQKAPVHGYSNLVAVILRVRVRGGLCPKHSHLASER